MESVLDLREHTAHGSAMASCVVRSPGLRDDETLHLIYDYEPRPLRRRFESNVLPSICLDASAGSRSGALGNIAA